MAACDCLHVRNKILEIFDPISNWGKEREDRTEDKGITFEFSVLGHALRNNKDLKIQNLNIDMLHRKRFWLMLYKLSWLYCTLASSDVRTRIKYHITDKCSILLEYCFLFISVFEARTIPYWHSDNTIRSTSNPPMPN